MTEMIDRCLMQNITMKGTAGGQEDQAVRWEAEDLRLLALAACQLCQPQNMNIKAGFLMDN